MLWKPGSPESHTLPASYKHQVVEHNRALTRGRAAIRELQAIEIAARRGSQR